MNNSTGEYQLSKTTDKTSLNTPNIVPYGVKYSYKVRAINSEDETAASDFSNIVTGTNKKLLQTPTLSVKENSNGTFTLSWKAISGVESYQLCQRNDDGTFRLLNTTTSTSVTTAVEAYGKECAFKVRAITNSNVDATSAFSNIVTAVNTKKLQTPTLKVTVNSSGTFKFSWGKITGADKYQIYVKNSDGSYKLYKTVTGTSVTSGVQTYNKQYTYKVRAVNNKNNSATSAYSKTVSAKNTKKLGTPTLKVAVNSNGTFKLSWNKITGADKYKVYVKNSDGSYKLYKTVTGTSLTTGVQTYNKQYTYKVRAVNSKKSAITSAYSNTVDAKNTKKLPAPSNVKISVNKNGSFKITWNKVTGADKYQVYVLDSRTKKYTLLKTTTSNSVTTGVATKGVTYKYKVRAVKNSKSSATSAYSSVVSKKR